MNTAYNLYPMMPEIPYKIMEHLITDPKAEPIWKILKYATPDALNQPNLTHEEKAALIYKGEDNILAFNLFLGSFVHDGTAVEKTFLKIFVHSIIPENRTVGIVNVGFEILTHPKIYQLDNYQARIDVIIQTLLNVLQDSDVCGLGNFFFDQSRMYSHLMKTIEDKGFSGKILIMGVNMA